MSFQAVTWALKRRTGNPSAKAVLMALANYAGPHGECFVAVKTLAADTEQSADSVRRRLRELEEAGSIATIIRRRKNGSQTTSEIVVLHDIEAIDHAKLLGWRPGMTGPVDPDGPAPALIEAPLADCEGQGLADCDPTPPADCEEPPSTGARGPLAAVRVPEQSLEQLPYPSPIPPGAGEGLACATWEEFDAAWRWNPVDIKAQGQRAFEALSPEHRALAVRYAAAYGDECRRRSRKIPNARTWLRDRGWEALAAATAKASPTGVFIEAGSPQHAAWSRHHGKPLFVAEMTCADGIRRKGRYEPAEWPPPKGRRAESGDGQANSQLHAAG